ncbi:epimerase [Pedobacter faecalis]|uniref:epimerase n=1 Tax=Pedobacter faecalis TaxID=3041495 RepID=UPI00254CA055|nr:epimerase [Pedobacter sp. ELA7]
MQPISVIITGTTGMVGEGVLLECLDNPKVGRVLGVSRKPCGVSHPKFTEYLVPDFLDLQAGDPQLKGYDACFFCAGISSLGMSEADFKKTTYDTTMHFAEVVSSVNPGMTFTYVSGAGTDSTEKGFLMWARVKGKTENDLQKLPFKKVHNFRPMFMKAMPGQRHTLSLYKYFAWLYPVLIKLSPNSVSTLQQVARCMILCATSDIQKPVLEVSDINALVKA